MIYDFDAHFLPAPVLVYFVYNDLPRINAQPLIKNSSYLPERSRVLGWTRSIDILIIAFNNSPTIIIRTIYKRDWQIVKALRIVDVISLHVGNQV